MDFDWGTAAAIGLIIYVIADGANRICKRLDAVIKQLDQMNKANAKIQETMEPIRAVALMHII